MNVPTVEFVQVCHVVNDLDRACNDFHDLFGIGPFIGGGEFALDNHVYRGVRAEPIVMRGAFVQSGELVVELVQPISTGPSAFSDMFSAGQQGVHHMAMFCEDYVETRDRYVAAGMPVASEFRTSFGAQICYIDARERMGHMLELYPENEIIRGMFARTRREAARWDRAQLFMPW